MQDVRYYEALGKGHDDILRCTGCRRLIKCETIRTRNCCPKCGNRRFAEIVNLTLWEYLRIRLGILRFTHKKEFLQEFPHWLVKLLGS